MIILKILLAIVVIGWTALTIVWPAADRGTIFYVAASVLSVLQFYKPGMTKWCIAAFVMGMAVSVLFPMWSKP
jgi:hypothetical protein